MAGTGKEEWMKVMKRYFPNATKERGNCPIIHFKLDYTPVKHGATPDTYLTLNFKNGYVCEQYPRFEQRSELLQALFSELREFFGTIPIGIDVAFVPSSTPGKTSPFLKVCLESTNIVPLIRHRQVQSSKEGILLDLALT
jgi:hypothetical protein